MTIYVIERQGYFEEMNGVPLCYVKSEDEAKCICAEAARIKEEFAAAKAAFFKDMGNTRDILLPMSVEMAKGVLKLFDERVGRDPAFDDARRPTMEFFRETGLTTHSAIDKIIQDHKIDMFGIPTHWVINLLSMDEQSYTIVYDSIPEFGEHHDQDH